MQSTVVLSGELFKQHGIRISDKTVAKLLREHGYSLQAPNKSVEGAQHADREAQFEYINAKAQDRVDRNIPVISVDTRRRSLSATSKTADASGSPRMSRSSSTSTISPVMQSARPSPTGSTTSPPTTDLSASASITTPRSSRSHQLRRGGSRSARDTLKLVANARHPPWCSSRERSKTRHAQTVHG